MSINQSITPYTEEGVDRKALARLNERFLQVHALRMQRWQSQATGKQRFLVEMTALFLDVNHPLLPGYVGKSCPARVFNFKPDAQVLQQVRTFSLNYTWQKSHLLPDIQSVYLMGSCGTIAQTSGSDLDFWVCVREGLLADETALLRRKLDRLSEYAQSVGVQASFFLMQATAFRLGHSEHLSHEDCGATQHHLLLDEFYRSSLWIAGAYPLWWLVPVAAESQYAEFTGNLLQKRHLQADKVLDLGAVLPVPAQEFLGAGLWQLFKGIDSPFKSVLKILLAEVYASEGAAVRPLSLDLKEAVYLREINVDALDPYVLLYERVAHYLQSRGEFARLELARQCFYLKTNENLSRQTAQTNWRRQLLQRMVALWGWTSADLRRLDTLATWALYPVRQLQDRLVQELEHAYRVLQEYAQLDGLTLEPRLAQDLVLLGRRLEAVYREQPGKVLRLNRQLRGSRAKEQWWIQEDTDTGCWLLREEEESLEVVYSGMSLIDVVLWTLANELATSATRWRWLSSDNDRRGSDRNRLSWLISRLLDSQVLTIAEPEDGQLGQSASWESVLIVIHHCKPEAGILQRRGLTRVADKSNPLAYGEDRQNFLQSMEVIIRNSWQELLIRAYEEDDFLAHFFLDILSMSTRSVTIEVIQNSPGQLSGQLGPHLGQVIQSLLQIRNHVLQDWIYLMRTGSRFLVLIHQQARYQTLAMDDLFDLHTVLRHSPERTLQAYADPNSLYEEALGLFLTGRKPGMVRMGVVRRWFRCQLIFEDGQGGLWLSQVFDAAEMEKRWLMVQQAMRQEWRLTWLDVPLSANSPLLRYWPLPQTDIDRLRQVMNRLL